MTVAVQRASATPPGTADQTVKRPDPPLHDPPSFLSEGEERLLLSVRKALKQRAYYMAHRAACLAGQQRWRVANREQYNKLQAKWRSANPEKVREISNRSRLRRWVRDRGGRPCVACAHHNAGRLDPSTLAPPHDRCVVALSGGIVVAPESWPLPTSRPWLEDAARAAVPPCDPDPWWA